RPAPPRRPTRLPPQGGATSPFRRRELPTPSLVREGSGRPGPRYWQQRADYAIRATLDTASHSLRGDETIRYGNNSPDTLRYVWLQLDQNLFADGSRGAALNPPGTRFAGGGFVGGYTIDYVKAVRRGAQAVRRASLVTTVNGTVMRVDLDQALPPGGVVSLEIAYSFQIPEHGGDRMGREQFPGGWLYELAQWYPRLAVYDDVRGWNTDQYLGLGGGSQLHLGRPRAAGRAAAVVLPAGGERRLGPLHRVRAALDQALLREVVPLSLSHGDQRRGARRRDGVSDDRVLLASLRRAR